jgi:hypothetical protein
LQRFVFWDKAGATSRPLFFFLSTDNDVSDDDDDGNYATMINETSEILGKFFFRQHQLYR